MSPSREMRHEPQQDIDLGPGEPPDAPVTQIEEMIEIHVGLVAHDDFACGDVRADLAGALVVVLPDDIDDFPTVRKLATF